MAKDVTHETTITLRCDGCAREDIRTGDHLREDVLPEGWGTILYVEELIPRVDAQKPSYSAFPIHEAHSEKPFRLILCCFGCSKKLYAFFKQRDEKDPVPLSTTMPLPPPPRSWLARFFLGK